MLFHVSEESGIRRFDPRPVMGTDVPVVWAIDRERLRNYLLPRDCPRVTFFAGPRTTSEDADRFLGSSKAVVAFETAWLERVRRTTVYNYHLADDGFTCVDACAGYYHSGAAVVPMKVEVINDLLFALANEEVEIRVLPSLWALSDAVATSTLNFSIIRMRNAQPRPSVRGGIGNS